MIPFSDMEPRCEGGEGFLEVDGVKIPVYAQKDPAMLPWKDLKVDVVIESTGFFRKEADARKHIAAGAKKVVISAPSEDTPTFLRESITASAKSPMTS